MCSSRRPTRNLCICCVATLVVSFPLSLSSLFIIYMLIYNCSVIVSCSWLVLDAISHTGDIVGTMRAGRIKAVRRSAGLSDGR